MERHQEQPIDVLAVEADGYANPAKELGMPKSQITTVATFLSPDGKLIQLQLGLKDSKPLSITLDANLATKVYTAIGDALIAMGQPPTRLPSRH